jgi:hypothetical protein
MTHEEAIDYYMNNISLPVWSRVIFLAELFAFGWWFWLPLLWLISPEFAENSLYIVVPPLIICIWVSSGYFVFKHMKILMELKKLGYKKWRWLQWNPKFIKKTFGLILPTKQEREKYHWLEFYSVGAIIFPLLGILVFVSSFFVNF